MIVRSLDELAALEPRLRAGGLDRLGVAAAWGRVRADDRTAFAAVRIAHPPAPLPRPEVALDEALVSATKLAGARRIAVAIGGGIDAPLAVLAARRAGFAVNDAIHVTIPGTAYGERTSAEQLADALGLTLHVVETTPAGLGSRLPRAVRLMATPLYNLHPVSRVLVAEEALAMGADTLLTGDGADQAAANEAPDYVPVVAAITRGMGLAFVSPFLDTHATKSELRALARAWGVPEAIVAAPKKAAWAPPLPRASFPSAEMVARAGRALGEPLGFRDDDDRNNVGVASLAALVAAFEVEAA